MGGGGGGAYATESQFGDPGTGEVGRGCGRGDGEEVGAVEGYGCEEEGGGDEEEEEGEEAGVRGGGGDEFGEALEGWFGWRCSWRCGVGGGGGGVEGGHRWLRAGRIALGGKAVGGCGLGCGSDRR